MIHLGSEHFDTMKSACLQHGFSRRGNAFFRVIGDGVLQVLKYKRLRGMQNPAISVGLFSLYGELQKQWLTSPGCIPRYILCEQYCTNAELNYHPLIGWDLGIQLNVFLIQGLPWLDTITTQAALAEAICLLDIRPRGSIPDNSTVIDHPSVRWNDDLKFAPFLQSGQFEKARRVVEAILQQHADAAQSRKAYMTEAEYSKYFSDLSYGDLPFTEKLEMVKNKDHNAITDYLQRNYAENTALTAFCRK